MSELGVAIVGAGPYGLSVAAHCAAARVPFALFGEPMGFWRHHVPDDMLLRSPAYLSSLSAPRGDPTLVDWLREEGVDPREPVTRARFVAYADAFVAEHGLLRHARPGRVVGLEREASGALRLRLESGDWLTARAVVVATGQRGLANVPPLLRALPPARVAHTSDLRAVCRGTRVLVVGGAQSAFEHALGAARAGATATVVLRAPRVRAASGHGPAGRAALAVMARTPDVFRRLPDAWRGPLRRWLVPRTVEPWLARAVDEANVDVRCGVEVSAVVDSPAGVRVTLSTGDALEVDLVVAATGYQADLSRVPPLDASPALRAMVRVRGGLPVLDRGCGSSVPGLFFVGSLAADSFGPAASFVVGAGTQARALVRRLRVRR